MEAFQLNPGKLPNLAHQWVEAAEALDRLPAVQQSELRKACLQQVLEGSSLQEYGPEKWRLCGTGASLVARASEPEVVPK